MMSLINQSRSFPSTTLAKPRPIKHHHLFDSSMVLLKMLAMEKSSSMKKTKRSSQCVLKLTLEVREVSGHQI